MSIQYTLPPAAAASSIGSATITPLQPLKQQIPGLHVRLIFLPGRSVIALTWPTNLICFSLVRRGDVSGGSSVDDGGGDDGGGDDGGGDDGSGDDGGNGNDNGNNIGGSVGVAGDEIII
ncbi:hypothetical protein V1478_002503 [Vespula squamosa]|uniref:Uncharacterized protein n=1 Tax=Vespula squamosa TaxID=30214 RepID=A0ABD2BSR0_VESSQ